MFTGIVEELGELVAAGAGTLTVRGPLVCADARPGDSIAVNGVCLTVVEVAGGGFTVDVMAETLRRSALATLAPGDPVNLERAATATTRLGGHLVQGHVDGVGTILDPAPELSGGGEAPQRGAGGELRVGMPPELSRYLVEKGSITVDGVSLTVVAVTDQWFQVSLIPTTLKLTTLGRKGAGDPVNLEVDVIAKYVERLLPVSLASVAKLPAAGARS
jgi:riboflavin synthase